MVLDIDLIFYFLLLYLFQIHQKHISFLILHGSADTRVNVFHGYRTGYKCQKLNLLYKLIIFPNGDHGLSQYEDDVMNEVIRWNEKYN